MMFISRTVDVFLQKNPQARDGNLVTAKENMVRDFPPAAIKVFFWTHPWQKEGSLSRYRIEAAAINKWDIKYKILRGGMK